MSDPSASYPAAPYLRRGSDRIRNSVTNLGQGRSLLRFDLSSSVVQR
jgi:hypothetical protein